MKQQSTNVVWHDGHVDQAAREALLQQKGVVIWFTGLSGSGKSTIAVALEKALFEAGQAAYRLDGDNVRHGLNGDLGFSDEDRTENIRRISEVAKLFVDAGLIVMSSFISPFRVDREAARAIVGEDRFIEVFVDAPLETCEQRDPKGLYKKARAGEIPDFTGIDSPYEAPEQPEITLHTDTSSVEECVVQLMDELAKRAFVHISE